jgi:hypothetical protein
VFGCWCLWCRCRGVPSDMAPVKGGSSSSLVELMKTSMNAVTGGGTEPRLPLAKLISRIQRTPSGGISGEQVGITRGGASVHPRAVGLTGMRLACVWGNVRRCWTSGRRWWSAPSCCSCFPSPTTQPSSQCFRSVRGSLNCGRGKTGVARSARWGVRRVSSGLGFGFSAWGGAERGHPHRTLENGFIHHADSSRTNLAAALAFQTLVLVPACLRLLKTA